MQWLTLWGPTPWWQILMKTLDMRGVMLPTNTLNLILMCFHSSVSFCHPDGGNFSLRRNTSPWDLSHWPSCCSLPPCSLASLTAYPGHSPVSPSRPWPHLSGPTVVLWIKTVLSRIGTLLKSEGKDWKYIFTISTFTLNRNSWYTQFFGLLCFFKHLFTLSSSFTFLLHFF